MGKVSYCNLVGRRMANGRMLDGSAMTAAMLHVPKSMGVQVTNVLGGKTISVTVTDRGPYEPGRIIDLTPTAFTARTGGTSKGVAQVEVAVPRSASSPC